MRGKLESYRSMQEEITELRCKLEHMLEGDSFVGNDVVMDYRSGYPVPQAVVGFDYDRYQRRRELYQCKIARLEKDCQEAEEFVEGIQDSLTRRIFRMYFLEGKSQGGVARILHMDQSSVSKKISQIFKMEYFS